MNDHFYSNVLGLLHGYFSIAHTHGGLNLNSADCKAVAKMIGDICDGVTRLECRTKTRSGPQSYPEPNAKIIRMPLRLVVNNTEKGK